MATAKDVQETVRIARSQVILSDNEADSWLQKVKYANLFKLPFLATGGTHGSISSLGALDNGVNIYMRKLKSITIEKDGRTAIIEGGVINKDLTDTLWKYGKQTGEYPHIFRV